MTTVEVDSIPAAGSTALCFSISATLRCVRLLSRLRADCVFQRRLCTPYFTHTTEPMKQNYALAIELKCEYQGKPCRKGFMEDVAKVCAGVKKEVGKFLKSHGNEVRCLDSAKASKCLSKRHKLETGPMGTESSPMAVCLLLAVHWP